MNQRSSLFWPTGLVCVVLTAALAACETRASVARDDFSTRYSCPAERVTVTERPDLRYTPLAPESPPPDISADAARLAVWQRAREDVEARYRYGQSLTTVFEVSGCEARQVVRCYSFGNIESFENIDCRVED